MLKISALKLYSPPLRISGAIYEGVPHFLEKETPIATFSDNPKSAILTSKTPSSVELSRMLDNLISL